MLPEWTRAYEAVWALLPITREHITEARSCITPGAILYHAGLSKVNMAVGVIPRWEEHESGEGLYSKMELFDRVFAEEDVPTGEMIFIVDECFPITKRKPIFCTVKDFRRFIAEQSRFVFDSDVVFIWERARRISVFDHEGVFAHIDCGLV